MSALLGPGAPDENDESTQATPASADPLQLSGPELEPEEMAALAAVLEAAAEEPGADRPSAQEPPPGGSRRSLPTDEVDVWNLDHGHSHPDDDGR